MKKHIQKWAFLALLLAPFVFSNCSKEKEDVVLRDNSFIYDNKVYDTKKGAL